MKHTPTPWNQSGTQIHDATGAVVIGGSYGINRKEDTPFIVTSCNAHESLVAALERARDNLLLWTDKNHSAIRQIDEALAMTESK